MSKFSTNNSSALVADFFEQIFDKQLKVQDNDEKKRKTQLHT